MKYFSLLISIVCVVIITSFSSAEVITLEWDAVEGVDGYYLYQSQKDSTFHYDIPVTTEEYSDGKIPQSVTRLSIDLSGYEGADTRYRFVARSFKGEDTSEDSNEVEYYVSLVTPPSAISLEGSYNKEDGLVNISWEQPEEDVAWRSINHWIVYYRIDDGDWEPIGRINSDHELSMEAPFSAVEEGESKAVEFTIVSYRRSGVYSANSGVLTIDIDREEVPPIQNLRIRIDIPVE